MSTISAHRIVGDRGNRGINDDYPALKIAFRKIVRNRSLCFGADDEAIAAIMAHSIVPHRGLRARPRDEQPKPSVVRQEVVGDHHAGGRAPNVDAIDALLPDLVLPDGDVGPCLDGVLAV